MPTPAIVVEGLSKQYHIGARENQKTFREAIADALATPFRRLRAFGRSSYREEDTIWALKDVSFEVQPGEVLGIIGRNGAGKSTLLRILTRITEPTQGRAILNGRVGSLLEVGTGFHQELTGRENIYLSGAILGMGKQEIKRKFDEIVDFSGVERFIDTPVKRYSSGMRVRLGFAVAAHLDPEILLIDEVLAVGDAEFQKKCLGKMDAVAKGGRTVLFVSHNMAAAQQLCGRGVYLDGGKVACDGDIHAAVARYLSSIAAARGLLVDSGLSVQLTVENQDGTAAKIWGLNAPITVKVLLESERQLRSPAIDLAFYSETGTRLSAVQSDRHTSQLKGKQGTVFRLEFTITNVGLTCEQVSIDLGVRANLEAQYAACWQNVETMLVSSKELGPLRVRGTLVYLPCQVKAEAIR